MTKESMSAKHTPGSWTLETLTTKAGRNKRALCGSDGKRICDIAIYDDAAYANARLIAAAPDLLKALIKAETMLKLKGYTPAVLKVHGITSTISKATGEA